MRVFTWMGVVEFRKNRRLYRALSDRIAPLPSTLRSRLLFHWCHIRDWWLVRCSLFRRQLEQSPYLWWGRRDAVDHPTYIVRWNGWLGACHDVEIRGYWWAWPRRNFDDDVGYVVRGADGRVGPYQKGHPFEENLPPIAEEDRLFLDQLPPLAELERRQAQACQRLLAVINGG